ncbi:TlpA disulfide reductase family protein [Nocardioides terrisoli]|uniref:TlpA disulfide reductase family protein n=1 Tax=Nocardioides terrisoli TaxID=3388267 RepID=UPI00287BC4E7|nr:TlpA disulfide reductase family protein [Nocardioides marmorisolisilvae]
MSRSRFTPVRRLAASAPPRPARVVVAVLLSALLAGALSACGAEGTGDKGYVDGHGVITELPPAQRHQVGAISGDLLDGGHFDLADHRGKVVVINVWGSWCAPCRAEAHVLAAAAAKLRPEGVLFVGINTRDASKDNGRAFDRAFGIDYPSIFDPSGRNLLAFHGAITPSAIPSTIVIDGQGRIAASVLGELTSSTTLVDLVHDTIRGTVRS